MSEAKKRKVHAPEFKAKAGLSSADKPGSVELLNLFGRPVPDWQTRQRILVYHPQRLFRF